MTTTTSTTSTATTTGSSIAVTLGIGSGIDTSALVTQLAAAEKAPAQALITTRQDTNTAQISSLATISSSIDSFASALTSLIGGGTLFTQPTSTDGSVVVSAIAGQRIPSTLSSSLKVTQLAQGQTLVSNAVSDPTAAIGQGTLTLTNTSGSFPLTIGPSNNSLTGLRDAINNAGAGVVASILTDSSGARLVVKGGTGTSAAFSISANSGADPGLSAFTYDSSANSGGMTAAQTAQNATLVLDGVSVSRSSNTISDLIPGVKLSLQSVSTTAATIGASVPTDAISSAVQDFVSAYNEMKSTLDTATASGLNGGTPGPFSSNSALRDMKRQLAQLTSTPLVSSGAVTTLADLGVSTQQDGTLAVNTNTLNNVLATNPDDVAALFNPTQTTSSPNVQIKNSMGGVAPGTYTITNLTVGPPPSGNVNGTPMIVAGSRLVAPQSSGAGGLVLAVTADTPSATVTVEAGLGGALQSIRDNLRANTGPLQALSDSLSAQAKQIANDQTALDTRSEAYEARLSATFTTMNSRVSVLKATQSYLDQQIKVWTNSTNS